MLRFVFFGFWGFFDLFIEWMWIFCWILGGFVKLCFVVFVVFSVIVLFGVIGCIFIML